MHTFKDEQNREWDLSITVGTIRRVKAVLKERLPGREIDLLKIDEGQPPLVALLSVDVELIVDVIWTLVKERRDSQAVTDEEFVLAMGGDAMVAATAAFWGELRDFFQKLGRKDLAQVIQTQTELLTGTVDKQTAEYAGINLKTLIDETWEAEKAKRKQTPTGQPILGSESTSLPGLPVSIPTAEHSVS
ncbi:MAG: hypothetical protein HY290_33505 [Planctomycetia bacterium]|nr:hypothetical protein [Planctomycetia bacterium]